MKNIVLFGAGKSATSLIEYLGKECEKQGWAIVVCDADISLAKSKISNCKSALAVSIDINDDDKRTALIHEADLVISMLPPHLHSLVAVDCLRLAKHLLTASYVDEKIKTLEDKIKEKNILFLCEMGLDPGIDHMSAMKMINEIKNDGAKIISFMSHCGGLIAPESDDNPWHYKITWNPANIVMAGSSGALFKSDNKIISKNYTEVFGNCKTVVVPALGSFAWYPNRDSLSYIDTYKLHDAATFIRTTLRSPSFCNGWNALVNMGFTDTNDHDKIENCTTYKEWFQLKKRQSNYNPENNLKKEEFEKQVIFLGLNDDVLINNEIQNSASLLQNILEKKLAMKSGDKDMIVMLHEIIYEKNGKRKQVKSSLIVKGDDQLHTAMAKTVGLPLGIAAKLILQNKIKLTGLHISVMSEIYEPVLLELEKQNIKFNEEIISL